jgi:hypothetical protein
MLTEDPATARTAGGPWRHEARSGAASGRADPRGEAPAGPVDSFKFHAKTPRQFRNDHEKTAALEREGIRLVRVTWWQIVEQPLALAARLARLLG